MKILFLPTERPGLALRELASEFDDQALFEAIDEDRRHLDRFGNTIAVRYHSPEDAESARLFSGSQIRLGIWDFETLEGEISGKPAGDREVEIGLWLRAGAVGNGYATLALKAFTAYLENKFRRVFAEIHVENTDSQRVFERAGYKKTGEEERYWGRAVIYDFPD